MYTVLANPTRCRLDHGPLDDQLVITSALPWTPKPLSTRPLTWVGNRVPAMMEE
jgi:hypothetical protein